MTDLMYMGFLGPIGGPELILLLILMAGGIATVIGIIALAKFSGSRGALPPPLPPAQGGIQHRLAELEGLKNANLVTYEEYEEKRKRILGEL